jgi:DNA modification methylase
MRAEIVKISDVKVNPNNPRLIKDDKFAKLVQSIKDLPQMLAIRPIVVNTDMVVLGGNMRLKACKEAGLKEVPIIIADNLTEEQQREFLIKDNVSGGEWDWQMLANDWDTEQLNDWGLDIPNFEPEQVLEAVEDDYEVPDGGIETDIVLGDLFEIGEHRLLCGDSTDSDAVARLMDGSKADMVFTDPPYRMEAQGGSNQPIGRAAAKLGKAIEHLCEFDPVAFLNTLPIVFESKKMNSYIFCNKDLVPDYLNWAIESGYSFNILFWKKPNAIPLGEQHRPDTEYLLFFRKSAIWNNGLKDVNYSKCLEFGRDNSTPHPTMKPIELISNEIKISSNKNGIVFDFFLGSGSTMVASHQLNRKCYGMELDPKYCQVIVDRMLKLDPSLKVKRNGIEYITS